MFTFKRIVIAAVIIIAVLAPVAWWLLSPIFTDTTVEEDFPLAANAVIPADMTMAEAHEVMIEAASKFNTYDERVPEGMAMPGDVMKMDASAQAVKSGDFRDGDSFHKGSGTATIYRAPDGRHLLRLEDFRVTNGPDLRVLLVPASNPQGRDDVEGYLELGKLKGNLGNQNYFLPDGEDAADYHSVVIFCYPFKVVFSVATLS